MFTSLLPLLLALPLASASPSFSAPQRLHLTPNSSPNPLLGSSLLKRAVYSCNPGTTSCKSIGYTQLCCNTSETCHKIDDIGYGPVGCCPSGQSCSGNLSGCSSDQVACSRVTGGGCCNAGSTCTLAGCIVDPALGAQLSKEAAAATTILGAGLGAAAGTAGSGKSTTSVAGGAQTTSVAEVTEKPTTTAASSLCDSGWRACAVAAGGGCCPNGFECGILSCPAIVVVGTSTMENGAVVVATREASAIAKRQQNDVRNIGGTSGVGRVVVGGTVGIMVGAFVGGLWLV